MENFFETVNCTLHVHCKTCRDFIGGREWRKDLSRNFAVPSVDFECPFGKEWKKKTDDVEVYNENTSQVSLPVLSNETIKKPVKKTGCCGRKRPS